MRFLALFIIVLGILMVSWHAFGIFLGYAFGVDLDISAVLGVISAFASLFVFVVPI